MGNPQRNYLKKVMFSLFDKEAAYDAGPAGWTASSACSMLNFAEGVYDEWPDKMESNKGLVGGELPSRILTVRQDLKIPYEENQATPNSLAGFLALTFGTVAAPVQDAGLTAYRHKFTKAASYSLPSIAAQVMHEGGRQYKYTGIKSEGITIAPDGNKEFIKFTCPLLGSGTRATAADAFAASISENPLLWGNAKIFLKPTGGIPITVPVTPAQGAANLGASNVDISSEVLEFGGFDWKNNLAGPLGYRAGGGKVRQNLKSDEREGNVKLTLEIDQSLEGDRLDYFLNNTKLAFELNIDSGTVIANGGAFKYGLILLVPQIQFTTLTRSKSGSYETFVLDGTIMDDGTNSEVVGFVYNAQAAYLV